MMCNVCVSKFGIGEYCRHLSGSSCSRLLPQTVARNIVNRSSFEWRKEVFLNHIDWLNSR
jgi:hypothetical protein